MPQENMPSATPAPNDASKILDANKTSENPFSNDGPSIEDAIKAMENTEEAPAPSDLPPQETPAPQSEQWSKKFAELAKMETKYQNDIKALKNQINELKSGSEGKLSRDELLEQLRNDYKTNPREFLEKQLGGSYDSLSDFILNEETRVNENKTMGIIDELRNEIKSLKEERDSEKQSEKTAAVQKQENEFKGNIKNYVSKNPDFSLVDQLDASETVFDVMMGHYDETGETMDINDACAQVENFYVEQINKIKHLDKVKKLFSLDNKTIDNDDDETISNESDSDSNTITNEILSMYSSKDPNDLSESERIALATQML